jgi:hypothetical protein
MTQPWDSLMGASTGEALTRQSEPGAGRRVATPPSRLMVQCSGRILQIDTVFMHIKAVSRRRAVGWPRPPLD